MVDPGNGYWLMFENGGTTVFSGDPIQDLTLSLSQDWNLISGTGSSVSVSSIEDPDGLIIPGTVYGFDETYINDDTIEPGKGYWLRSSGEGEITFSGLAHAERKISFYPPDHLNRITINNMSLYFGMDVPEKEILSYSLPPMPPAPAADIRFSGDTKLCTLDECLVQIMNDGQPIIVNYDIKDGEIWEIVDENGNVILCSGVQMEELNSELESFNLRKSISPKIPTEFALFPAHPNPFNPSTTLMYELPEQSFVTLTIYDMLGKEVITLVNSQQQPGYKSVRWDATDRMGRPLSGGVYLYRIIVDNLSAGSEKKLVKTLKIVLLK